tara:strand:- start:2550 stop:3314 length:765 start_codon:yes stop_codon:yes gene_type:complete
MMISKDRCENDAYFTPTDTIKDFLETQNILTPDMTIWECSCGDGQISKQLEQRGFKVISTDLNDYGYGVTGVDFLKTTKQNIDCIITNPPYRLAEQFIDHALKQSPVVIMLLRLTFLEGQQRSRTLWKNTPLHRVYICGRRPSMYKTNHVGEKAGGFVAYAWYVWKRDSTDRKLEWIIDVQHKMNLYRCLIRRTNDTTYRLPADDKEFKTDKEAIEHYESRHTSKGFEIWTGERLVHSSPINDVILNGGQHILF